MNELEQQFFDILLKAPTPRDGARQIAAIVEKAAHAIAQRRQAEAKAFNDLRAILDRFYAYEGRVAGMIEAVQLLDEEGEGIRDMLTARCREYRDEMNHYHVLLKAMQ